MASKRTAQAAPAPDGLDKAGAGRAQVGPGHGAAGPAGPGHGAPAGVVAAAAEDGGVATDWSEGAVHRGRLRVRNLVTLRWLVTAGEAALLVAMMTLGLKAPY